MSLETIGRLSELTGRAVNTVTARVSGLAFTAKGARTRLFESQEALPLIYDMGEGGSSVRELTAERARLSSAQANKAEIEVEVLRGNLFKGDDIRRDLSELFTAFRARLLAIPTRAAQQVAAPDKFVEVVDLFTALIEEALSELATFRPTLSDVGGHAADTEAPAEIGNKPVGRPRAPVKPRKRGGARQVVNGPRAVPARHDGCAA